MKSDNTKEKILKVTTKLLSEHGYSKTSLSMIAEKVGIKKASLYYHFKNKDQLIGELFKNNFIEFEKEMKLIILSDISETEKIRCIINKVIALVKKHPQVRFVADLHQDDRKFLKRINIYRSSFFTLITNTLREFDDLCKNPEYINLTKTMILGIIVTSIIDSPKEAEKIGDSFIRMMEKMKEKGL